MTKTKSTKRALLTSALALLMCVSMLIGSTFAWFTDSVTSNGNIIQAGNLNVEMYWAEGDEDPATLTWNKVNGAIFDNEKWEPGYVEAKHVKITNEGNLAFKWRLRIVPNGTVEELADVIDVYYIEGAKQLTREMLASATPVCTLRELINDVDGAAHGAILPVGETATDAYERVGEVTATLAFKMREDAGNEYQGKKIGTDFSLQLMATQYTYEDDSFNNQYDVNAEADYWDGTVDNTWYDETANELVITTAEELAAFAAQVNAGNTFEGKTVKLDQNIDLIKKQWTPIGNSTTAFKGTFDGQNYTISNLTIEKTDDASAKPCLGLFGIIENATLKNVTIQNANVTAKSYNAAVAVLVSFAKGANTLSNITVSDAEITAVTNNKSVWAGGLVGYAAQLTMNDINVSDVAISATVPNGQTAYVSAMVGYHDSINGVVTSLDNFTISGVEIEAKAATAYVGGIFGNYIDGNMTVTNGTVDGLTINSNATSKSFIGGLFGRTHKADPTKVENVAVTNLDIDFTCADAQVGGIVGSDHSPSRDAGYKNVTVQGSITENTTGSSGSEVGGFVASSYEYPKTYTNCSADVDVVSKFVGGGFAGESCVNGWGGNQYDTYINCSSAGDVTAPYAGGFIAHCINHSSYVTMKDITVSGNIHGTELAGGIIATTGGGSNSITLTNAKITGTITGKTVAGVCANTLIDNGYTFTLTNVESTVTPLVIGSADKVVINNP